MPSQPVQVSIEKALLKRIDTDPETKKLGRSAFIRSAVELYLRAKERREVDQAIRRAYSGKRDELLAEIEDLIEVQRHYVGTLGAQKMRDVCHALNIACGCD